MSFLHVMVWPADYKKEVSRQKTFWIKLDKGENEKYKVETIFTRAVYNKKTKSHLLGLYQLVLWKGYPKEESTWEPALALLSLHKIIGIFNSNYPKKPVAISLPMDSISIIARFTVNYRAETSTNQKCS